MISILFKTKRSFTTILLVVVWLFPANVPAQESGLAESNFANSIDSILTHPCLRKKKFGAKVQRFTEQILQCNLGPILASDAHMSRGPRSPDLLRGYFEVSRIVGSNVAKGMVSTVPLTILDNEAMDLTQPIFTED